MKECPNCHASAADTAKFCMKCGFNFKKHEEENTEIFCPECGTKFKGGDFCPECGTNVKAGAADAGLANGFGISPSAPAAAPAEDVFANDNWLAGLANVTAEAVADKKKAEADAARAKELAAFTYETHVDGKVTVTGLADKHALEVTLPECVIAIADGAFENSNLVYVWNIDAKLLRIGKRAFANCTDLVDFDFSDTLISIGDEAFLNCEQLQESFPDHVKRIGKDAFRGSYIEYLQRCEAEALAEEAAEAERLAEEALLAAEAAEAATRAAAAAAALFEIKDGVVVKYKGKEKEVVVPDGVTAIGKCAFEGCEILTSVTLPVGVTTVGESAFDGCTNLVSVTLPEGLTKLQRAAFWGCKSLESITLPEGITELKYGTFYECSSLKSVALPEGLTKIDGSFMYCGALTAVTIPATVKTIGFSTFSNCTVLKSVTFAKGSKLTNLCSSVFASCPSLESITIPASVKAIDEHVFILCNSLKSVTFENPVGWQGTLTKRARDLSARWGEPPLPSSASFDFSNPARNAKILTDTHYDYDLKRK